MSRLPRSWPAIEVPGFGMRVHVEYREGKWTISGWRQRCGFNRMVAWLPSGEHAPVLEHEDDEFGIEHKGAYLAVPAASVMRLQAFLERVKGGAA